MINLIPPTAKKSITVEYWLRVVSVWALLFAFAIGCVVFVLLPAYVLISTQVTAYTEFANTASAKMATYENVSSGLIQASQEAKTAIEGTSYRPISEYVQSIEQLEDETITITNITVARTVDGISPIQLTGVAVDRQSLAAFRDRLLAERHITTVDLPIANLAKDKDILFSITVTIDNTIEL
jgi:hypothetical protein